jgi:hypothetical protein
MQAEGFERQALYFFKAKVFARVWSILDETRTTWLAENSFCLNPNTFEQ